MNVSMSNADPVGQYAEFQHQVAMAAGQQHQVAALPTAREAIKAAAIESIEALASRIQASEGCSREESIVRAVTRNPSLYDTYLQGHPAQTGHR